MVCPAIVRHFMGCCDSTLTECEHVRYLFYVEFGHKAVFVLTDNFFIFFVFDLELLWLKRLPLQVLRLSLLLIHCFHESIYSRVFHLSDLIQMSNCDFAREINDLRQNCVNSCLFLYIRWWMQSLTIVSFCFGRLRPSCWGNFRMSYLSGHLKTTWYSFLLYRWRMLGRLEFRFGHLRFLFFRLGESTTLLGPRWACLIAFNHTGFLQLFLFQTNSICIQLDAFANLPIGFWCSIMHVVMQRGKVSARGYWSQTCRLVSDAVCRCSPRFYPYVCILTQFEDWESPICIL